MQISPPGSRHLRGLMFGDSAWDDMLKKGARGYLFDPDPKNPSVAALKYIEAGEKKNVHTTYKCRMRTPWWRVPRAPAADAFFTYMNHDTPRIVANRASVGYLNSIHGIKFNEDRRQLAMDLLPMASLNSVTLLASELTGRAYGGGILKLEPKEADSLHVPSLKTIEAAEGDLRALRPQLAKDLRQGQLLRVVRQVDRVLRSHLNLSQKDLQRLRDARAALFSRRVTRSKSDL
jgi:adenine-specific DNA-methyltransferase